MGRLDWIIQIGLMLRIHDTISWSSGSFIQCWIEQTKHIKCWRVYLISWYILEIPVEGNSDASNFNYLTNILCLCLTLIFSTSEGLGTGLCLVGSWSQRSSGYTIFLPKSRCLMIHLLLAQYIHIHKRNPVVGDFLCDLIFFPIVSWVKGIFTRASIISVIK